jgi:hypothetical protein
MNYELAGTGSYLAGTGLQPVQLQRKKQSRLSKPRQQIVFSFVWIASLTLAMT